MVVHDNLLNEIGKVLNAESYVVPGYAAYSTSDLTLDPAMTSFSGETPVRTTLTASRTNNVVSLTGIKTGTIVGASGQTLYEQALFDASTSGTLLSMQSLPSVLHTTSYDIETNWDLQLERDQS
jgi:hypothetical protein